MQYVAGESLQERLDRTGPLGVEEVVRIGLQTASGLAAAHAQGLIHRDIKPSNLMLETMADCGARLADSQDARDRRSAIGKVKITDFGLARMADDVQLTQAGVVAGTPGYMAPEQARGEIADHRSDLFSLGSVLYACCTGKAPFHGPTPLALLHAVNERTPVPLRSLNAEVPAWLAAFIDRLMAKEPRRCWRPMKMTSRQGGQVTG
jgi:serine/threonine-protein kinase